MSSSSSSLVRALACATLGIVLIVLAGLPARDVHGELPRAVTTANPLAMWFSRLPPSDAATPAYAPRIVKLAAGFPQRAGVSLDVSLRRLLRPAPSFGYLARTALGVVDPDAEVRVPQSASGEGDLPVRRIEGLGARAEAIHRVSAENASLFPDAVRRVVADLIDAVERSRSVAEELLRSRDRNALGAAELLAALSAPGDVDLTSLGPAGASFHNDVDAWLNVAIELADTVDRARRSLSGQFDLAALRTLPDGEGVPRNLVFASECDAGLILIGGPGTTVMPMSGVAVAIDLAGDDVWHADAAFADLSREVRAGVAIDVSGADSWRGNERGLGLACDAVTLWADLAGDDVYECAAGGLGSAWNGASLVVDFEGDDRYSVDRFGLGFGAFGAGLLADLAGDDVYRGDLAVLGVGAAGGLGAFVDSAGDDLYITDLAGRANGSEFSAGASCAVAKLGGGVGIFVERAGKDTYRLGKSGGGSALGGGVGAFFDCGGDDLYGGAERCFGTGRSGGFGVLRDYFGDDDYLARGNSIGCGSGGTGVFVDDSGRDTTMALDPCRGAVEGGGFSIFADVGGLPTLRTDDSRSRRR